MKRLLPFAAFVFIALSAVAEAALTIPFTINLNEPVTVTGTPRVAVDVGGQTRYATFTSGNGTSALTFTLSPQAGDVDLDGIAVSSPIDLNGGTIKDLAGNNLAALTFTPPNTAGIKVNYPSLGMDFIYDADGRYTLNGTVYNDLTSFLTATGGTFTRTTIGTYYDSIGVLQTAASGAPRFDYDPVTHAAKGILIEESRTNLLIRSSEFDNAVWTKGGGTVQTDTTVAPDGTLTADRLTEDTSSSTHRVTSNVGSGSVFSYYTFSIYVKAAERNKGWMAFTNYGYYNGSNPEIRFDLSSGIITSAGSTTGSSIRNVGNGWYKISMTAQMTTLTSVIPCIGMINSLNASSYIGDSLSGFYLWGAQLELGPFPTSYIPTTTAAVTRAADVLVLPISSPSSEGALFARGVTDFISGSDAKPLGSVDDNSGNNAIQLRVINNTGTIGYGTVISGSAAGHNISTYTPSALAKIALGYKTNLTNAAVNGALDSVNTSISMPVFSKVRVGGSTISNSKINGWIEKLSHYPVRISDVQLQLLTQ